ncbi:MAG: FMN-dependent NADH-azoreductase [Nodosilinea sp.]
MAHLLHIDTSPRGDRSRSRRFTREFTEAWKQTHPADTVTYRDIGRNPIPHLEASWIAAAYTPPAQHTPELQAALRISDQLVDEMLAADLYVLGVPMYNFSIPSVLKAYIDNIVRIGRTFNFKPEQPEYPYEPLVLGKKMVIIVARGASGYGPGERFESFNFQDPYLSTIFGFIGITDITFVPVENDEMEGEGLATSMAAAQARIAQLVRP